MLGYAALTFVLPATGKAEQPLRRELRCACHRKMTGQSDGNRIERLLAMAVSLQLPLCPDLVYDVGEA
eukprot:6203119-Pleurochrysis_carterae.AAC.3